jgi:hypothetical protein
MDIAAFFRSSAGKAGLFKIGIGMMPRLIRQGTR